MHQTHNTLPEAVRMQSVAALNRHLAAAIDLHGQLKQAHWNVRGPGFMAVHELFDTVATGALAAADLFAERAAGLGGTAEGTIQIAAANSFLVPYALGVADVARHVAAVSAALAGFGQSVRDAAEASTTQGDTTTADLFTEISRGIDLHLWFVEAHRTPA